MSCIHEKHPQFSNRRIHKIAEEGHKNGKPFSRLPGERSVSWGSLGELGFNDFAHLNHVLPEHADALRELFGRHRIFI